MKAYCYRAGHEPKQTIQEELRDGLSDRIYGLRYQPPDIDEILKYLDSKGVVVSNGTFDGCDWFDEHDMTHGCSVWDYCPALKSYVRLIND